MSSVDISSRMRLYDRSNHRLYINAEERAEFLAHALQEPPAIRGFCLTLLYTGCRISEALELNQAAIQPSERIITFRTLKRRRIDAYREVPIPPELVSHLISMKASQTPGQYLWHSNNRRVDRITAYRWIKSVMTKAGISGTQACPKGLRHGYGIHAIRCGVQLNMLQKWMGHASMSTTAIYANAMGADELAIADRMWG